MKTDIKLNLKTVYHEKQFLGHCAIHCLNNLFQTSWINYKQLNQIANELCKENDNLLESTLLNTLFSTNITNYKSIIPYYGSFDINCIIKALSIKQYKIVEHILSSDNLLKYDFDSNGYIGLIIHTNQIHMYMPSNHWFSMIRMRKNKISVSTASNRSGINAPKEGGGSGGEYSVYCGTSAPVSESESTLISTLVVTSPTLITTIPTSLNPIPKPMSNMDFDEYMYVLLDSNNEEPIQYNKQGMLDYIVECITKHNGQIFIVSKE